MTIWFIVAAIAGDKDLIGLKIRLRIKTFLRKGQGSQIPTNFPT